MKTRKFLSLFLAALMLCGILTGCGASSGTAAQNAKAMAFDSAAAAEEYEYAVAETAAGALSNSAAESGSTALPEGRKWIITMDMYVETDDLDVLMEKLDADIGSLEGYVEDQSIHNGSTYASYRYRSANLTVRIPAESVDKFTECVSGLANVVSQNLNREDITLQYTDTESRLAALETEEARLLELLAEAETMADLLEIEARLTDVRYELESYTSQKRLYDNQIDYATIYLNLEEVQEYTPVEEPSFWERITETFSDSLEGLAEGAVDVVVFIIGNSPYILVFAVLAVIAVLLLKRVRRVNARKRAREDEQKE